MSEPERHVPLPGVLGMPRFLWHKLGRGGRLTVVLAVLALLAATALAVPRIRHAKREHAREERRQLDAAVARTRRHNARDQAPHRARAPAGLALVPALEASITADARARLRARRLPEPPVRSTRCHDGASDLPEASARARRHGGTLERCIAFTTLRRGPGGREFGVGFEFLGVVVPRGRVLVWCKTNPLPAEKFNGAALADVPLARACTDPRG